MNIDMALTPIDRSAPFVLDLYHYRGRRWPPAISTFDEAGALDVHLPSYATLASAAKETAAADRHRHRQRECAL